MTNGNKGKASRSEVITRWVVGILVIGAVILVIRGTPSLVIFQVFTTGEFLQEIAPLLLVALFVERALEVFVTAWRGGETDTLRKEAAIADKAASEPNADATAKDAAGTCQKKLVQYKGETRRIAFMAGIAIGTVIAAVGIRAFEIFVDAAHFETISSTQQSVFHIVDVIVTGAVIGGGADGLHKVIQVFTNFMESTAQKVKPTP
jgi:hypothetical protein